MRSIIVFIITFSFLFAGDYPSNELCYKFDKKYFKSNLKDSYDVKIDVSFLNYKDLEDKNMMIWLDTSSKIDYLGSNSLYCMKNDNQKNSYYCVGDDDSGQLYFNTKGKEVYLNLYHITLAQTPDEPVVYQLFPKEKDNLIKGEKVDCL